MTKRIIQALNKEKTDIIPFWFMRQAGRYLPEYRQEREKAGGFLNMCYNPELASKITLQPIKRFDMDAAIIFSDILVIPDALGQKVSFVPGKGPVLEPYQKEHYENASHEQMHEYLKPVYEALKITRQGLASDKTLIGFSAAPWTLLCYILEGGSSKAFESCRRKAIEETAEFDSLVQTLQECIAAYLIRQIESGADVVQIFDSWSGITSVAQFRKYIIKPTKWIVEKVKAAHPDVKIIGFPKDAGFLYIDYAAQTGVDGMSVDFHTPLTFLKDKVNVTLQGNLDPLVLAGNKEAIKTDMLHKLDTMRDVPFIFNLGHGVVPYTPIENVELMVKTVREYKR